MHILEKNEQLDYHAFYHTPSKEFPHGRVSTVDAGRATWQLWQGMADHYPCPPCKPFAQALSYGGEDVVRLLTGRPLKHNRKYVDMLIHEVDRAKEKLRSKCRGGHCHG